jgi:sporulation protein YunB
LAKFRARPQKRGPLPLRYVILLTIVFFIFSSVVGLWAVNKGIEPTLMRYAESETRNIAALVINKAITKRTTDVGDNNEVIELLPNENGKQNAKLNTAYINRVLAETTAQIQKNLKTASRGDLSSLEQLTDVQIETKSTNNEDGIVWYVPLGQATNIALLGNMGPKIPIRFHAIGEVKPNVKITTEQVGINNIHYGVSVDIEVSVQIITPFATKITKLQQSIPVGDSYIQGDVPQFYNNGGGIMPSIQLPDSKANTKTTDKTKAKSKTGH